ncbi:MAG: Gx transporter family protein [Lachnospiraceae bacterium]|nr:Gx transporter family protein [Lachnospiraceae bacterium]
MKTKHLTLLAMYTTIALTIFVVESALPPLLPIPGVKLGLANIVTLWLLLCSDWKDALWVLILRIVLGSIFAGQVLSFAYSLSGGLLCLAAMAILHHFLGKKQIVLTSILGAVFHNIGQLLMAFFILQSLSIISYLPVLFISGIAAGTFTGLCAKYTYKRMGRLMHFKSDSNRKNDVIN